MRIYFVTEEFHEEVTEEYVYVFRADYFFDTNFHLNLAGVQVYTLRLGYDIKIARGDMSLITDASGNLILEEWEPLLE